MSEHYLCEKKVDIYKRKSTNQWVVGVSGYTSKTTYTVRYSSRFKLLAWIKYKLNFNKFLLACL